MEPEELSRLSPSYGVSSRGNAGLEAVHSRSLPDTQNRQLGIYPVRGLKQDSSVLRELEAGVREANEKSTLSSKLYELGMELRKVR